MKRLVFVAAVSVLAIVGCRRDRDNTVIIEREGRPAPQFQPHPQRPQPVIVTPQPNVNINVRCDPHNHCGRCPYCHSQGWHVAAGVYIGR